MKPTTRSRPPALRLLRASAGLVVLALKRTLYRPGLSLLALAGILLAVSLVTSGAFFAQAMDRVLLGQELDRFAQQTGRPPFSMRVYEMPYATRPLSLEDAAALTPHVAGTLAAEIGLPLKSAGFEVESGAMLPQWPEVVAQQRLQAEQDRKPGEPIRYASSASAEQVNLIYFDGVADHIRITGEPLQGDRSAGPLDVWPAAPFAEKAGLEVGDEFVVRMRIGNAQIPVRVRGIWQPLDAKDPFWFSDPTFALNDALFVRRQDFSERIQPMLASKTRFVAWHVRLDESEVLPERARLYLRGFQRAVAVMQKYLPGSRLDIAPLDPLQQFVQRNRTLTTMLLAFNVPAFGFLLYFLALISAIVARWQRRETAILISRGAGASSVVAVTLIEQLLLLLIGIPAGAWLGARLAQFMGSTVSFLSFAPRPPLPVSQYGLDLPLLAAAVGVSLLARLWPAARAARQSVVEQQREQARPSRAPAWQRYYLDLLLVAPTAYAYWQLAQRGTLALLVKDRPSELYQDPLLILLPALFVLAASLMAMRLFPILTWMMDRLAGPVPWITPHLALRELGRGSQAYINPLLLIIVCLALGVYTYSLAASLDQWLIDRMYYRAGADLTFRPEAPPPPGGFGGGAAASGSDETAVIPIAEYRALPGVAAAARVGDYRTSFAGQGRVNVRFLGIDRLEFPAVAWFREDLAGDSLGGLMNRLAAAPQGILVGEEVLAANQIRIGDEVPLTVDLGRALVRDVRFKVVGSYRNFPTVFADKPAIIGNLDYLFSLVGSDMQYSVWLRLEPGTSGEAVMQAAKDTLGIAAGSPLDAGALIAAEQAKSERVGVFGTLSIGFLAAALMALSALLINTYASLNDRLHRFTVLHALGLRRRQILGQVLIEYAFLTAYGAVGGAAIGAGTSYLFAPFFRITGKQEVVLPELVPIIPQALLLHLAAGFATAMLVLELLVIGLALYRRLARMLTLRGQL